MAPGFGVFAHGGAFGIDHYFRVSDSQTLIDSLTLNKAKASRVTSPRPRSSWTNPETKVFCDVHEFKPDSLILSVTTIFLVTGKPITIPKS